MRKAPTQGGSHMITSPALLRYLPEPLKETLE